ncbi:T-complex protein 1 subunit theta [Gurleya vavrai]
MDFSNPSTNLLSKKTHHTSSTYESSSQKLLQSQELVCNLFGVNSKSILINSSNLTLTSLPDTLYSKIPMTHVVHKLLKENISKIQSLGDGSTFMCNLTCLITKNLLSLVQRGMSRKRISETLKQIRKEITKCEIEIINEDLQSKESLKKVLKGILKNEELERVFVDALTMIENKKEIEDRLRIVKMGTGMLSQSFSVRGMIFKGEAKTNKKEGKNMRTSILNCPIEISKTTTKGVVLLETAEELLNFSKNEEKGIEETVKNLVKNSNLILCNGKVEDLFIDYFDLENAIVYSIYSKHDIRRIRNLLGGCISPVLREIKENGNCLEMVVFEEGNNKYTKFIGEGDVVTIVLKNSINVLLDEYERILNKGITVILKNYDNNIKMTKGSGAFERKIGDFLRNKGLSINESTALVYKAVGDSLFDVCVKEENEEIFDVYDIKIKAVQYAIDICSVLLETEDYFHVRENLNIQPRRNPGWDNDD